MVEHLVFTKTRHWDKAIRELTGKALGKLAPLVAKPMVDTFVPVIVKGKSTFYCC